MPALQARFRLIIHATALQAFSRLIIHAAALQACFRLIIDSTCSAGLLALYYTRHLLCRLTFPCYSVSASEASARAVICDKP